MFHWDTHRHTHPVTHTKAVFSGIVIADVCKILCKKCSAAMRKEEG